ncbi:hypothetical protein D3C80_1374390 [compost metagenome]
MMPFPLKIQYTVHHMLKHPGAGNGTLLGNMANQHCRNSADFGNAHKPCCTLPYLCHAAGRTRYFRHKYSLNGVDDQELGLNLLNGLFNALHIGFAQYVQLC